MLTNGLRVALLLLLVSAVAYAGVVVDRWHGDSVALATVGPLSLELIEKNADLAAKVQALTDDKAALKEQIGNQNHAVELAQAAADNAKALQEQARTSAAKEQQRASLRIGQLEADLADTTKTLTNMLDNSWRQAR